MNDPYQVFYVGQPMTRLAIAKEIAGPLANPGDDVELSDIEKYVANLTDEDCKCYMNTVVVHTLVARDSTFSAFLRRIAQRAGVTL